MMNILRLILNTLICREKLIVENALSLFSYFFSPETAGTCEQRGKNPPSPLDEHSGFIVINDFLENFINFTKNICERGFWVKL